MLRLHQSQILLENDPHVLIGVAEFIANGEVHVDERPVLESHSLGKSWVLVVEVLEPVQGYVGQPPDLLSACPTKYLEVLVPHMNCYLDGILPFHI